MQALPSTSTITNWFIVKTLSGKCVQADSSRPVKEIFAFFALQLNCSPDDVGFTHVMHGSMQIKDCNPNERFSVEFENKTGVNLASVHGLRAVVKRPAVDSSSITPHPEFETASIQELEERVKCLTFELEMAKRRLEDAKASQQ